MYEFFKDFAGPIATVIASAAASYVAYRFGSTQAETARGMLEATKERTVLDLFDRRWHVIEELRNAVAAIFYKVSLMRRCISTTGRA